MLVKSTSSTRPTSAVTAANTSSGAAPWATSVATRRRRGLLVGEPAQLDARLRVGDRHGDQLGEARASRASASAGNGTPRDVRVMTPQSRPSTLTGTPTAEREPHSWPTSRDRARGIDGVIDPRRPARFENLRGRIPAPELAPIRPPAPRVARPCCSRRPTTVTASPAARTGPRPPGRRPSSRPTSSATAANTSSGAAPRPTSVATRRSAACSSAIIHCSVTSRITTTVTMPWSVVAGLRLTSIGNSDPSA